MSSPGDAPPSPFLRLDGAQKLYIYLGGIFVACLLLGDITGGKTIPTPLGPISVGILPFPVTFLLTDIVNDFYGARGARFLTFLGFWMAALAWVFLQGSTAMPTDISSYFSAQEFSKIFGGSAMLFVASMISYLAGQLLDIRMFQFWKALTNSRHLWLRATGSTITSQLLDTVAINQMFWNWSASTAPESFLGKLAHSERQLWIVQKIGREYSIKVVVAVLLTPLIYAMHAAIVRRLKLHPVAVSKR